MENLQGLLLPLLFLAVLYLLLIRPQQKRRKEQQQLVSSLKIGDDIVTIGGLHGRVIGLGDKTMDIEVTADSDVVLRFERGSLGRVVHDDTELDDDAVVDDDAVDDTTSEE